MRVLIIEDHPVVAQALRHELKRFYTIDICNKGTVGLIQAQTIKYDTIILDLGLPDIKGEKVCKLLREKGVKTPIIILTGNDEVKSKIDLLNMGADDYMTKPFNFHELRARIGVAMRYTSNNSPAGIMEIEGLKLNPSSRTLERYGDSISLRRKEFDVLEYLMRNAGQTLTRAMILEHIWDMNENLWANVVDVHVKHLRDKIDRPYNSKLIKTVHGLGYKIQAGQ